MKRSGISISPLKRKVKRSSVSTPRVSLKTERKQTRGAGVVLICGEGDCGQLGLGDEILERSKPTLIPGLTNIVDVCAGGMHTLCLDKDGKVFSWGCNDEGALGRDTSAEGSENVPGAVLLDENVVQVSAGDSHSAALTETGKVYAWGSFRDSHGTMGLTLNGSAKTPVLFMSDNVAKISSGADHLLLLTCDGEVYSVGCGEQGQLGRVPGRSANRDSRRGLGKLLSADIVYTSVRIKHAFVDIWSGAYSSFMKHTIVGDIYAFGLNNYHQLGLPKTDVPYFTPAKVPLFKSEKSWKQIAGGQHHSIALDGDGVAYALGRKDYGALGLGEDCAEAEEPTEIPGLIGKKVVNVSCGNSVSFAVTEDGEAYGWGMGSNNLGCSPEDDIYEPKKIVSKQLENKTVIKISSGGQHTVFLANTAVTNGDNDNDN